jgi:hypothetical protein
VVNRSVVVVPAVMSVVPVIISVPSPVIGSPSVPYIYIDYNRRVPVIVERIIAVVIAASIVRIVL